MFDDSKEKEKGTRMRGEEGRSLLSTSTTSDKRIRDTHHTARYGSGPLNQDDGGVSLSAISDSLLFNIDFFRFSRVCSSVFHSSFLLTSRLKRGISEDAGVSTCMWQMNSSNNKNKNLQ